MPVSCFRLQESASKLLSARWPHICLVFQSAPGISAMKVTSLQQQGSADLMRLMGPCDWKTWCQKDPDNKGTWGITPKKAGDDVQSLDFSRGSWLVVFKFTSYPLLTMVYQLIAHDSLPINIHKPWWIKPFSGIKLSHHQSRLTSFLSITTS